MNFVANIQQRTAVFQLNLNDENDRLVGIAWLKELKPVSERDQFEIDKAIVALGGQPETIFPGYEWMRQ